MTEMKKKGSQLAKTKSKIIYLKENPALHSPSGDGGPGNFRERPDTPAHPFRFFSTLKSLMVSFLGLAVLLVLLSGMYMYLFTKRYENKIYPNVTVDGMPFGGKTEEDVRSYWLARNAQYTQKLFEFGFEDTVATVSGTELNLGYDANLTARQAYLVGRSGNAASDIMTRFFDDGINVSPEFRFSDGMLDDTLSPLVDQLEVPVQEALFEFKDGKVTEFKPSRDGRRVDTELTKKQFREILKTVPGRSDVTIRIPLVVLAVKPAVTTDRVNEFGIKELIGRGYSEYQGSIPGRLHNVALAASKFHGVLIKPGEEFSFNDVLGDVSAATGFQQAYVIKNGRTVLGDGGGVCQVSSTLFRAALAAGLPIVERTAHAYRVHYYEEGGFKAGLDATVFAPSVDLKFKNDTPGSILIQEKIDESVPSLTFELYGTSDGRKAEILDHKVWGVTAPPPPLYQDDPTLPVGVEKQVDFAAWGAKASFQYKVTSAKGETLQDQVFYSNFRPWQAVFLKGTKTQ